jgi:hypothetical protein
MGVFPPLVSLGSCIQDLVIDCSLAYTVALQRYSELFKLLDSHEIHPKRYSNGRPIFLLFYFSGMVWVCESWHQVAKTLLIESRGKLNNLRIIIGPPTGCENETRLIQSKAWMCFCIFMTNLMVCPDDKLSYMARQGL